MTFRRLNAKSYTNKEIHVVIEDDGTGVSEDGITKLARRKQGISDNGINALLGFNNR